MLKLKNILQYRVINNSFYLFLCVFVTLAIFISYLFILVAVIYYIWIYKNKKRYYIYYSISFLLLIIGYFTYSYTEKDIDESSIDTYVVVNVDANETYNKYIVKNGFTKSIVYTESCDKYKIGDLLQISGVKEKPNTDEIGGGFDYRDYLKTRRIYSIIYSSDILYKGHKFNIYSVNEYISNYIDLNYSSKSGEYIHALFLGDRDYLDDNISEDITFLGISHLFAISGLHISFMILCISFILSKLLFNEKEKANILLIILTSYLIVTSFSISILRSILMFIVKFIFDKLEIKYSIIDCISISGLIILFINPLFVYDVGFLLSYSICFVLVLSKDIISGNYIVKLFKISVLSFFTSLPIVLSLNYFVNIGSIFYNILFVIYVSFFLLPTIFIVLIFKKLEFVLEYLISIFEKLVLFFSNIELLKINYSFNSILLILIYYLFLFSVFIEIEIGFCWKKRIRLVLYLLIVFLLKGITFYESVSVLDIDDGDSIFIRDRFSQCNMIIDTGNMDNNNSLVNYLLRNNITHLDYLVLTHSHSDHIGEAHDLLDVIDVDVVLGSVYEDYGDIEVNNVVRGDSFVCGNYYFEVLSPVVSSSNANNNSIVLVSQIGNDIYMFTGDIEEEVERELIDSYQLDLDVLKVAHHGSSTSSIDEFVNKFKPEVALISVDEDNSYNHPSKTVIDTFDKYNVMVYRTDKDNTIRIYYIFKRYRIIFK